ncbi:hypothetical protein DPMN_158884 [Dreissena polymorpha]|uniref:Uncharacterized protein n=1 Tax=Dreissena polymorpha TaxID=45954 RepID=A0A9D4IMD7_DREPO|nr:hypothetical protein DPMN_158881 [Dreissena polymorpha]KAH3781059.1 hypothetical protein DPMN_158884 [Dreissena polymorpha]
MTAASPCSQDLNKACKGNQHNDHYSMTWALTTDDISQSLQSGPEQSLQGKPTTMITIA